MHNYKCPVDQYEIWVSIATTYKCPVCGHTMTYITSKSK